MRGIQAAMLAALAIGAAPAASLRALLIDEPANQPRTEAFKAILESGGLFQVDVVTAPAQSTANAFQAPFDKYKLVVVNYSGNGRPLATLTALDRYVQGGGGLVVLPAAESAFPASPEFNLMIGVSADHSREKGAGPYWFYLDGNLAYDRAAPGPAGKIVHSDQPFQVTIRYTEHPITKGLPLVWMHAADDLVGNLRGPGKNMTVLATALSDSEAGTGHDELQLVAITYGKGRVFHTLLGRRAEAVQCAGFQVVLQRGAEWAATGKVTQKVPADFPGEEKVSLRTTKPAAK